MTELLANRYTYLHSLSHQQTHAHTYTNKHTHTSSPTHPVRMQASLPAALQRWVRGLCCVRLLPRSPQHPAGSSCRSAGQRSSSARQQGEEGAVMVVGVV